MDRNNVQKVIGSIRPYVALRKESVDRNNRPDGQKYINRVALRKESVDRNISALESYNIIVKSLSARRAWIEMRLDVEY